MKRLSSWTAWVNADDEATARAIADRIAALIPAEMRELSVHPSPTGYKLRWKLLCCATDWAHLVVETLEVAESLGTGWLLSGSVHEDPSGLLSRESKHTTVNVPGVTAVEWALGTRHRL
jgi:hypothetical protein